MRALKAFLTLVGALYCTATILSVLRVIDFKVCISSPGQCHVLFTDELQTVYQPRIET